MMEDLFYKLDTNKDL